MYENVLQFLLHFYCFCLFLVGDELRQQAMEEGGHPRPSWWSCSRMATVKTLKNNYLFTKTLKNVQNQIQIHERVIKHFSFALFLKMDQVAQVWSFFRWNPCRAWRTAARATPTIRCPRKRFAQVSIPNFNSRYY